MRRTRELDGEGSLLRGSVRKLCGGGVVESATGTGGELLGREAKDWTLGKVELCHCRGGAVRRKSEATGSALA